MLRLSGMGAGRRAPRAYVNLDEPAFKAFRECAATVFPGQTLTSAIREAILVFMGTDPMEASKCAARRAAWLDAKVDVARMIGTAMAATAQKFALDADNAKQELAELEAHGLIPPRKH